MEAKATGWAVALASSVHEVGEYRELYERVRDRVGGFPGLWAFWGDLGEVFAEVEGERAAALGRTVEIEDFPEAVGAAISKVVEYAREHGGLPGTAVQREIATYVVEAFDEEVG